MNSRSQLRRSVSRLGFFALAFGSMIGVGWVTALGSWFGQAGPGGAILAFLTGGIVMGVVGICYAELTPMLPVAGGEVAYSYAAAGTGAAFVVGWFLACGYLSVSVFEAVSIGRVASFMFPAIDAWPLYEAAGDTVFASHIALAAAGTGLITWINYRGVEAASRLQVVLTAVFIALTLTLVGAGLLLGSVRNVDPWFNTSSTGIEWGGVLAVFVTAPFWFVGFDTIPQAAEEAKSKVAPRSLGRLILAAIFAAALFYALLILSVAMTGPWRDLADADLATAVAFERAFSTPWLARLVLFNALIGLVTSWNGFFLAGTRVLFALGRGGVLPRSFGRSHPSHATPTTAVLFSGAFTFAGSLLGRGAIAPFVNVGSLCVATAFLGVSISAIQLRRRRPEWPRPYRPPLGLLFPVLALVGSAAILAAMIVPQSPAALSWPLEWGLLLVVVLSGGVTWRAAANRRQALSPSERDYLILGRLAVKK